MRVYLAYLLTAFAAVYAWKDWFPAASLLVLFMAGINHPDMPHEVLGVPGLNLWNVLLLATVPAWLSRRRHEGVWDLPPLGNVLLVVYVSIICVSFLRLVLDPGPVTLGAGDLVGEYILNPLKYLVPALMFFDGARTRARQYLGLASILLVYVVLAVLVVKWMPLSDAASGGELVVRGLRRLAQETGLHKNSLSVMLAGASWAVLAVRPLVRSRALSLAVFGLAGLLALAMALTGGRGGYLAWVCVGLVLGVLRWRALLVLGPLAVSLVIALAPGVSQRAEEGIAVSDGEAESVEVDRDAVSSGRLLVWPYMLAKVKESPWIGFGRLGYQRSGLYAFLVAEVDASFPHPHSAFIEWLLDNGWLGMVAMLVLYGSVLAVALILFVDSRHPLFGATGGVAFALVFAHFVGSATGRTWYPNEETVTVWAAVGLMMRVWVERSRGGARPRSAQPAGPWS
jgi:O-antigen ligase